MNEYYLTYKDAHSVLVDILNHALRATYKRCKTFLAHNWILIAWALFYVLALWYINKYQSANIVGGFN